MRINPIRLAKLERNNQGGGAFTRNDPEDGYYGIVGEFIPNDLMRKALGPVKS